MRSIDMQAKKQKSEQQMKQMKKEAGANACFLCSIINDLMFFQKKSAAYIRLSAGISARISNQFFFPYRDN